MVFSCRPKAATLPNCDRQGCLSATMFRPTLATSCTDHSTGNLMPRYLRRFTSMNQSELRWISMRAKDLPVTGRILQVLRQLRRSLDPGASPCEGDLILYPMIFVQKNQFAPLGVRDEISPAFSPRELVGVGFSPAIASLASPVLRSTI